MAHKTEMRSDRTQDQRDRLLVALQKLCDTETVEAFAAARALLSAIAKEPK